MLINILNNNPIVCFVVVEKLINHAGDSTFYIIEERIFRDIFKCKQHWHRYCIQLCVHKYSVICNQQ